MPPATGLIPAATRGSQRKLRGAQRSSPPASKALPPRNRPNRPALAAREKWPAARAAAAANIHVAMQKRTLLRAPALPNLIALSSFRFSGQEKARENLRARV